jgi:PAS domain S-box-containing protein
MKFPDETFIEQFQTIIHTLPDIIYKIDSKGTFTYINNAVTLIGYTPELLIGRHFSILFNEKDAEKISRDNVLLKNSNNKNDDSEHPKLFDERRTGNRITRNLRLKVMHNNSIKEMAGDIIATGVYEENSSGIIEYNGTLGVIRNIDEVDHTEHALILTEKHYRNLISNLSEIVFIIATDGTILFVTESCRQSLGFESFDIIGENIYNYIHQEDAGQITDRIWLMSNEEVDESKFSIRIFNISKQWLYFKLHMKKIIGHNNQLTCLIINAVDNTEQTNLLNELRAEFYLRKYAEKEKASALIELERISRAKSDFISTMSHEIRNPLNILLGFIDLISENNKDESIGEDIISMKYAGRELLGIVNQVLNFSKIESGKYGLDITVFNLDEMFDFIGSLFLPDLVKKNIVFTIEKRISADTMVAADRQKLTQVIINIISNAVKFTENGKIILDAFYDNSELKITISDTGIGIPPEKLANIFNPFYQADSSTSRKYGGTGLGLSIVSGIIESMKGKIDVESTVGAGSTFKITIPIELIQKTELHPSSGGKSRLKLNEDGLDKFILKKSVPGFKILLAEDDENNRKLLIRLLKHPAIYVDIAENGKKALEKINQEEYHLLLLDMHMPVLDGFGVLQKMEENSLIKELPVVVLTGHVIEGFEEECLAKGCLGMIPKPVDISKLFNYIDKAITWWISNKL